MTILVFGISLLIIGLGVLGIMSPGQFIAIVRRFDNLTGLYAGAAFRIVFGAALLFAAEASDWPETLRILGLIMLAAGIMLPFLGVERLHKIIEWWSARGLVFTRCWMIFAVALGLFLVYAVMA